METVKFEELGLSPQIMRAVKEMGFEEATPIQSQAIPVVMSGADVIGQAQTGTGKTASFGIPLLMKVDPNNKKTQAIVLSPQAFQIHARGKGASGIRWTGYYQTD